MEVSLVALGGEEEAKLCGCSRPECPVGLAFTTGADPGRCVGYQNSEFEADPEELVSEESDRTNVSEYDASRCERR